MNNKINITEEEKLALVNYLSSEFSQKNSEILNYWLKRSNENKFLFDQLSDIWNSVEYKTTESKIDVNLAWDDIQKQIQTRNKKISWKKIVRYAAIFIFAFTIGGTANYFIEKSSEDIFHQQMVEYVAPLGSRSFVQLSDGSQVWLNSGTILKYKNSFGKDNRVLHLEGEAFFEVTENKEIPFSVRTSDLIITAVGTRFNVKAYNDENTIETTLIDGSVKLASSTAKLAENIVLKPNEKAVFTKKSGITEVVSKNILKEESTATKPKLEIIKSIKTAPIVSWKDQRWIIQNEKLGQLAIKLERRFNVNFIFDNEVLKEFYFGGTLKDESLEQIMQAISYASPIKYAIQDNTVIIMSDGKKMNKFKDLLME